MLIKKKSLNTPLLVSVGASAVLSAITIALTTSAIKNSFSCIYNSFKFTSIQQMRQIIPYDALNLSFEQKFSMFMQFDQKGFVQLKDIKLSQEQIDLIKSHRAEATQGLHTALKVFIVLSVIAIFATLCIYAGKKALEEKNPTAGKSDNIELGFSVIPDTIKYVANKAVNAAKTCCGK